MSERRAKSATAFLTISEVSNALNIPQHILRFWETKFPQLRPLKRAGGRRYFRPEDVALVETINRLLGQDGYTIRGVQKLMREGEIKRAASHDEEASLPLGLETLDQPVRAESVTESRPSRPSAKAATPVDHTQNDRYKNTLREILSELVEIKNTLTR